MIVKEKFFISKYGIIYRVKFYGKCIIDMLNLILFEFLLYYDFFDLFEFDIFDGLEENWNVFFVKKLIENW